MNLPVKMYSCLGAVLLLLVHTAASQVLLEDLIAGPVINQSNASNRNVNYPDGVLLQDVKRATVMFLCDQGSRLISGTGTLINTTKNCFDPVTGSGLMYILTASHNIRGAGIDKFYIYLSADYEMAHATIRGSDEEHAFITEVFKLQVQVLVDDPDADIALLQLLVPGLSEFRNLYAAGWSLDPARLWANISHPMADHKKAFVNPASIQWVPTALVEREGRFVNLRNDIYWKIGNTWNGRQTGPESGSSGSSVLDTDLKVAGVQFSSTNNSNSAQVSPITNSWFFNPGGMGSGPKGLIDYLDPGNTWINKVPGGYIRDLIPPAPANYDISLHSGEKKEAAGSIFIVRNVAGHLREQENYLHRILGLKLTENQGDAKVFVTVTSSTNNGDYLLYGAYAQSLQNASPVTGFQENGWDLNSVTNAGLPYYKTRNRMGFSAPDLSNNFKQSAVNFMTTQLKGFEHGASQYLAPVTIKLFRQEDGIPGETRVQAIAIPEKPPVNALQLFDPAHFDQVWQSKKYRPSTGGSSNELFINKLTVSQDEVKTEIPTGNNGGYLNLVNPNFMIQTIKTSYKAGADEVGKNIGFNMEVTASLPDPFYYKIWMDFFPDTDANNNYNFVTDPTPHPVEILAAGSSTGAFTKDIRMPDNVQLGMAPGETKICRLRVAISNQNNVTQGGQYQYGEVEDYLVKIRVPTAAEVIASAATLAIPVRAGIQPGQGNSQCGVPAQEPAASPAGTPVNVGDATYPYSCNSYVCASSTCVANAANSSSPLTGEYSVCISGSADYIALDEGDQFIHNAFNNRTVSFWLNNTDDPGIEEVYDEGGSTEGGMGIRINNNTGKLELGVRNGTAFKIISAPVAATTWLHVVASFENGKLSLYQNGTLAASDNAVGFTTVPVHNDGAAFGGTNGTNVFGSVNRSYHGCADEILIFDKALTLEQVDVLYQAGGPGSTANPQAKQAETQAQTGGHLVTDRKAQSVASLIIYPNPSKGDVNIITEVQKAGPVSIRIIDLQGRVVYEKTITGVGVGFQQVALRNLQLKAATYIVRVVNSENTQISKLVIEN
ncbi:MAG: LamG-like jellyroll fold domain-containing protein [Bacteroidota bacterium]